MTSIANIPLENSGPIDASSKVLRGERFTPLEKIVRVNSIKEPCSARVIVFKPIKIPAPAPTDDTHTETQYADPMNNITREQLDSNLSAVEERMDKRMDRAEHQAEKRAQNARDEISLRDESFRNEQALRDKAADERFQNFLALQAERDKRIEQTFASIQVNNTEIKDGIKAMKNTVIVTAISAVLVIVVGIFSFNAMLTSNMIASFQMGRSERTLEAPSGPKLEPVPPQTQQK